MTYKEGVLSKGGYRREGGREDNFTSAYGIRGNKSASYGRSAGCMPLGVVYSCCED